MQELDYELDYNDREGNGNEINPYLINCIRASLQYQYIYDEVMKHRSPNSQWEHGGSCGFVPQGIPRSVSIRQPTTPPRLSRTDSMRQGGICDFMRGLGRRSAPYIIDIDPKFILHKQRNRHGLTIHI